jgi:7-carboxy-7-deazaguanine synthase
MTTLNVNEIFFTMQGESSRAGLPCAMVRLAGCNLDCTWCDTLYAREEAPTEMTIDEILTAVKAFPTQRVEITGGEPMLQSATPALLEAFVDADYEVLLETNGSMELAMVPPEVIKIIDIKCPSSGEIDSTNWGMLARIERDDEIKFVIADEPDYNYARDVIRREALTLRSGVILSPCAGTISPEELATWILRDGIDVRLGLQLHKLIWPAKARGV